MFNTRRQQVHMHAIGCSDVATVLCLIASHCDSQGGHHVHLVMHAFVYGVPMILASAIPALMHRVYCVMRC